MDDKKYKQKEMHKDFHDRCRFAIDSHFYFEAILMEYAAIESRLEAMCGVLGLPCGQNCPCRRDIKVSTRIDCLHGFKNANPDIFAKTYLPKNFFTNKGELRTWIGKRDVYVHGLYKNEIDYTNRISGIKRLAEDGYDYCNLLYKETSRIRRLVKNHSEKMNVTIAKCYNSNCKGNIVCRYYRFIEEMHDHSAVLYSYRIKWNTEAFSKDFGKDGFIVQKVSVKNNTGASIGFKEDYYEAWAVNDGIIEAQEDGFDDIFTGYPYECCKSAKDDVVNRPSRIEYKTIVYWVDKADPEYKEVDKWQRRPLSNAADLRSCDAKNCMLKFDKKVMDRPTFVHEIYIYDAKQCVSKTY